MPHRGRGSTLDLTRYLRRPDPNAGAALLAAMLKKDEEESDKALQEGMASMGAGLAAGGAAAGGAAAGGAAAGGGGMGAALGGELGEFGGFAGASTASGVTPPAGLPISPTSLPISGKGGGGASAPTTEGGFDWRRFAAGVADVLGSAGGRNPNYSGQLAKSRADAA